MTTRSTPRLPSAREDGGQRFGPVLLLLASLFPALSADAAVLRVNPDGSGDYPTIQAAIDAAAPYDTVALGSGLFTGPGQVDLYSDKVLTLRSIEGDPGTCILDGAGFSSALTAELGATVEAITFRRFQPGLTLWGASTLSDCVFREGGTMVEASWDVVMNRCRFVNNTASALALFSECSATDCWFEGNVAGGPYGRGGAIYAEARASHPNFTRCTFVRNQATRAGVIELNERWNYATFTNCTFYQNSATVDGSIACLGGLPPESVTFDHCLVIGSRGAPLVDCSSGSAIMNCSISWDNELGNFPACLAGYESGHDNLSEDPLFCDPSSDDLRVSSQSPAAPPNNPCGLLGSQPVGCGVSGVSTDVTSASPVLLLVPNPSFSTTLIRWTRPSAEVGSARATIIDASGRALREVRLFPVGGPADGPADPAEHVVWAALWDGRDQAGRVLPKGIYFIRATGGGRSETRSFVRLTPR